MFISSSVSELQYEKHLSFDPGTIWLYLTTLK